MSITSTGSVSAAADHLARLVGNNPVAGLAELIWNSLDADATNVVVTIEPSQLGAPVRVRVDDNGDGISPNEIEGTFSKVGGSWKSVSADRKTKNKRRELHGNNGQGRWKGFAIGDEIRWNSVFFDEDSGIRHRSLIDVSRHSLAEYSFMTEESVGEEETGTSVVVEVGAREPTSLMNDNLNTALTTLFALYLIRYPDVSISVNDEKLDVEDVVERRDAIAGAVDSDGDLEVTVIEWTQQVDRTLYLCDRKGAALESTHVGIQAPGFNFTAYVQWDGFREQEASLALADLGNPDVAPALGIARGILREHFAKRKSELSKSVVDEWLAEDVYPYGSEPVDTVGQAGQALFNYVAVAAASAVNSIDNHDAKKLSLAAMRVAVESDPSSIEVIFREILKLPQSKVEELRALLEKTSLEQLIDTMRMVVDRLDFLMGLETLFFDPDVVPKVGERSHVHKLIESAPWIFGEEFATHVSDQRLTTLLKQHLQCLGRHDLVDSPVRDTDGNELRRVDFMFGRSLEFNRQRIEHLVVEIKKPSLVVGESELTQLQNYRKAVVGDARFDLDDVAWDFVLLGTEFSQDVYDLLGQADRHPNLAYEKDGVRLWVRKWSDVFAENRHRLKFIRERLDYDPTSEQALDYLRLNFPDYLPRSLALDPGQSTPAG